MSEPQNRPLRVFLCHSSNDKPTVRDLYRRLNAESWIDAWLDEEKLYPGQDWNYEIENAVEEADIILVCLTNSSVTKEGYIQRELRIVLDHADYKPEGTLFIIPVRLEDCLPPRRLRTWQYADYFPEEKRDQAYKRLLESLRMRAVRLGIPTAAAIENNAPREPEERTPKESGLPIRKQKEEQSKAAIEEIAQPKEGVQKPASNIKVFEGDPYLTGKNKLESALPQKRPRSKTRFTPIFIAVGLLILTGGVVGIIAIYYILQNRPMTNVPVSADNSLTVSPTSIDDSQVTGTATEVFFDTALISPLHTEIASAALEATAVHGDAPSGNTFAFQLAFASSRLGYPQIFLINADGTALAQLTSLADGACQPSWSSDGTRLAFISPCYAYADSDETPYNTSRIYIVNADGTRLQTLPDSQGFDPAWSPDGKRIAFTSLRDGQKQIYVIDLDSQAITRLTDSIDIESSQPTWSPSGNLIIYSVKRAGKYEIWTMAANGEHPFQLTNNEQEQLWDYLPVWSPSGEIFFNQRLPKASKPWLMKINSEDFTQDPTRWDLVELIEDVDFSPDGLWLAFESLDMAGSARNRDIYYITITGSGRARLTDDPSDDFDPAWRPK